MNRKFKVNSHWLQKAFILLAFFGCLSTRSVRASGLPPVISASPLGATVNKGDTVTFTAVVDFSLTPLTITWNLNGSGKNIPHATVSNVVITNTGSTVSTLTISNAVSANAGNYSMAVTNGGGGRVSGNALLTVLTLSSTNEVTTVSILTQGTGFTNGGFQLNLLKPATSNCVIDATADLNIWTPLYTNSSGSTNVSYLDSAATNLPLRYYRARLQ